MSKTDMFCVRLNVRSTLSEVLLIVALSLPFAAGGTVKTWDGSSSGYWGTAANWTGGVAPVNSDDLVFPAAANLVNTNNYASLKLNSITFTGSGYTLRGNALTVTNGISGQQAAGANTVELIVTLGAAQTFDCTTAGASQTLSGNVTNAGFVLTVSGSGSVMLHGSISGAGGLTKNGTGILDLGGSQANTYAGATFVNDGVVWLAGSPGGNGAISGSALTIGDGVGAAYSAIVRPHGATWEQIAPMPITVNADGELDINSTTETIGTSLTLNDGNVDTGGGTLYLSPDSTITVSSSPTISGYLNVGSGTCTIQGSGTLHLYASVSGSANIVKNGGVYLNLYGANTFTGTLTANTSGHVYVLNSLALGATNGGTIINDDAYLAMTWDVNVTNEALTMNSTYLYALDMLSSSTNRWIGTFTFNSNTWARIETNCLLELDGPISGPGGVTKWGPGTLRYSGASANTYSGATVVNEGLLELNKSSSWAIGYGSLTIGDGVGGAHADIVRYTGTSSSELNTLVPITVNSSGLLDLNNHSDGVNGSLTLNDGDVQTGTGTLSLDYAPRTITVSNGPSISGRLSVGSGTCTIQGTGSLYLYADVSGTANIVKNDSVYLVLYGANTFTGTLTANTGGYIYALNNLALGATNGGTIINDNSMLVMSGVAITNEALTMNSSSSVGIEVIGSDTNVWAGPVSLSRDTYVWIYTNTVLDVIGPISGVGGITKWWPGTLRYSGDTANNYGGVTTVNEGLLELNKTISSGAIPYAGLVIGDGTGTDTVRCLRGNQLWSYGKPVRVNNSGVFDLNGFNETAFPLTLEGGDITTGAGQLYLSGTVTVLPAATTATISGNALLYDPVVITNAGHSSSPDLQISAGISSATGNGITKTGAGEVYLTASNSFSGPVTINNGDLTIKNSYALGNTNTPATVNSGGTLHVFGNLTIGAKPLVLNGPGWAGAFFVGALAVSDGVSSWAGPITNASDSTIYVYGDLYVTRSIDLSGPISGAGGLTKTGLGTLTFSGGEANTYAGVTRLNQGTLVLNKTASEGAIAHDLIIGDGVGGANADVVRNLNAYQIANSATVTIASSGLLDLTSGGEGVAGLNGSGNVNLGANYLNTFGSGSYTFDGVVSGTGTLYAAGPGIYTYNGNNLHTGQTYLYPYSVSGYYSTMRINGSQPQSPVFVGSGATLGGSGTVGDISCQGNLMPGSSAGCLTSSNLTFSSSGGYYVELNGTAPCTGYDQMIVRGTNNLANAVLHVAAAFSPSAPVSIGDQFVIINNDGSDAITGTFAGLPQGATIPVGGYTFTVSYTGGSGNDVVLTATDLPSALAGAAVTAGNGNHIIDVNECNNLSLVISNQSGAAMSGITATLSTTTPGVMITQPYSAYPDLGVNGTASNLTPFQISTLPTFACGTDIDLRLAVNSSLGAFTVQSVLPSGAPAVAANRYDNNTVTNVPDVGTIESTNTISSWTGGPLTKIVVSLWLVAPIDSDLNLTLIAPNGASVDLSSGNGAGANFGTGSADAQRTTFDDAAATSITAGAPPFVGTFRPEGSLSNLLSYGGGVGYWRLRIQDNFGSGSPDTLRAWSLFLYGTTCAAGGGACDLCLPAITGSITNTDLAQTNRIYRDGITASCGAPKDWPGVVGGSYHYDVYAFTNTTGADACVTVELTSSCDVQAALYLGSFDPLNISNNYVADAGVSTGGSTTTFSGTVPAGAPFFVTVNEVTPDAGCPSYTLQLSGLPCPQPVLSIADVPGPDVHLFWPSWAGGYTLDASTNLVPTVWNAVTNEPIVSGGLFNVTNSSTARTSRFYRLHKPPF